MFTGYNVIDPNLEITDPNPNIFELFQNFNHMFFESKLLSVTVDWSKTMKKSAGVCSYEPRSRFCQICLSEPLLKLRPRKDLVETLLHEMIHAYLFLFENDADREGHGPNFKRIMKRINEMTGANITIYHDFHDEVRHYTSNWYRCNGPCRRNRPLFGFVKGKRDRGPCNKDRWYAMHKATCGGIFQKAIRGPSKSLINKQISKNDSLVNRKTIQTTLKSSNGVLSLTKDQVKGDNTPLGYMIDKNNNKRKPAQLKKSPSVLSKKSKNDVPFSGTGVMLGDQSTKGTTGMINGTQSKIPQTSWTPPNGFIPFSGRGQVLGSATSNENAQIFPGTSHHTKPPIKNTPMEDTEQQPPDLERAIEMSLIDVKSRNQDSETAPIFVECPACPQVFLLNEIDDHLNECLS